MERRTDAAEKLDKISETMRNPTEPTPRRSPSINRAIFLDRDGVLISNVFREDRTLGSVRKANEVIFNESAETAMNLAIANNFEIFVVSNQPDIERKLINYGDFTEIDNLLGNRFGAISETRYCPHSGENECSCRKPKPGMVYDLAAKYNIDLGKSWMIGDRSSDMQAGHSAGVNIICIPPLVCGVLAERTCKFPDPHLEANDLLSAIAIAINQGDQCA
ncbi:MAG: HAD-IIIA family hydrolase [Actinomycetota bacterium]|nr:HAD-IIIA family hydrolase [Actinomycetota bacterium]